MKTKLKLLLITAAVLYASGVRAQFPIAYYAFENSPNGSFVGSGTAAQLFINSGCSYQKTGTGTLSGTSGNGKYVLYGGPNNGLAASMANWPTSATNPSSNPVNSYEFTVNTTGLATLTLVFDYRTTGTKLFVLAVPDIGISYSINGGTTWTSVGTIDVLLSNTWLQSSSFSLPAVTENVSNLKVRIYGYNANSSSDQLILDNVIFYATATKTNAVALTSVDEKSLYQYTTSGGTGNFSRANFTVVSGSTLVLGSDVELTGTFAVSAGTLKFGTSGSPKNLLGLGGLPISGTFTASAGSTLKITSTAGITSGITQSGNVQVSTRTYDAGANYEYVGASAQTTGNGLPVSLTGDLTINNTSGILPAVTLSQTMSTTGGVSLTSGVFAINSGISFTKTKVIGTIIQNPSGVLINGGNLITKNGTITNNGLFQIISGTASIGTASGNCLVTSDVTFGKFIMQGGTLTVAGRLVNTAGSASITGGIITVNTVGNADAATGSFDMSLSTNLTISGTPTISFQNVATGGLDLHILNSTGTKNITGGTFVFGNGSTASNSTFQCYSDVPVYNVTVNATNSPNVSLQKDFTVNGALALNSVNIAGAFLINSGKTLTVNGTVSGSGMFTGSQTSGIVVGGSITKTFSFVQSGFSNYLKTLTVNSGVIATLGNALNITGSNGSATNTFGTLTVNSGAVLNTNGNLILQSDIFGDARVGISLGTINGNPWVWRFIPARRAWRFICVPGIGLQTINAALQEGSLPDPNPYTLLDPNPGFGTQVTYMYKDGTTGYDSNTTVNPSIKYWNPNTNTWAFPATTYIGINTYPAYCLFVRGDRKVKLNEADAAQANTTTLRYLVTLNQHNFSQSFSGIPAGNFVMVQNPYASAVDLAGVLARSSGITKDYWAWDPKLNGKYQVGAYVAYNSATNTMTPLGGSYTTATTVVQSGQAFMVKTTNASGSVDFQELDKTATEFNVFGRNAGKTFPRLYINLMAPSGDTLELVDGVAEVFGNNFSRKLDEGDTRKLWGNNGNIGLQRDSNYFAIEALRAKYSDTIFMYLSAYKNAAYTLKMFGENVPETFVSPVWLVDNFLGTQTEVSRYDTTMYSFSTTDDTLSYRHRFVIVANRPGFRFMRPIMPQSYGPAPVADPVGECDPDRILKVQVQPKVQYVKSVGATQHSIHLYPNPTKNILHISGLNGTEELVIIDMFGKTVLRSHAYSTMAEINCSSLSNGFYVLKVISKKETQTIKFEKMK